MAKYNRGIKTSPVELREKPYDEGKKYSPNKINKFYILINQIYFWQNTLQIENLRRSILLGLKLILPDQTSSMGLIHYEYY
jgi:hypothetical protein